MQARDLDPPRGLGAARETLEGKVLDYIAGPHQWLVKSEFPKGWSPASDHEPVVSWYVVTEQGGFKHQWGGRRLTGWQPMCWEAKGQAQGSWIKC